MLNVDEVELALGDTSEGGGATTHKKESLHPALDARQRLEKGIR